MTKFIQLFVSALFLTLVLFILPGCEKPTTTPELEEPVIHSSFSILNTDTSNSTVLVKLTWASEHASSVSLDGATVKLNGDTTVSQNTNTTKVYTFVGTGKDGKTKISFPLKVFIPDGVKVPTLSIITKYNGQITDTLPIGGGQIEVNCIFENGILELNGVQYFTSPTPFVFTINENKTYVFKVVGIGGTVEKQLNIIVKQPLPPTALELYMVGSWKKTVIYQSTISKDGPWTNTGIDFTIPCQPHSRWTFNLSPEKRCFVDRGISCSEIGFFDFPWSVNPDNTLNGVSPQRTIIEWGEGTLVLEYEDTNIEWDEVHKIWVNNPEWTKTVLVPVIN